MLSRRSLITGLGASLLAAPAVVRAASLMPVRGIVMDVDVGLRSFVTRYRAATIGLFTEHCGLHWIVTEEERATLYAQTTHIFDRVDLKPGDRVLWFGGPIGWAAPPSSG